MLWFRRDLRLADHPALTEAARLAGDRDVLALFVVDPALWVPAGDNRRAFLLACLRSLDADLGGRLVVRHGDPAAIVPTMVEEVGATTVVVTADFGPYGTRRDDAVESSLAERGCSLQRVGSPYAIQPGVVLNGSGQPYKVFTPFSKAWLAHGWPAPLPAAANVRWATAPSDPLPPAPAHAAALPVAGEAAAQVAAEAFLADRLAGYDEARDRPGVEGTSRLSPYLKWGCIHPRQLMAQLGDDPADRTFRAELCWREFYADVLHHRPETARLAFNPAMAVMEVDPPSADDGFEDWTQGRTGFPIIDAGMRQLLAEGWMHNRVRMLVASFLVKDLHLDWTRGARWFMQHLTDGDLASNQHGWQWVAGTGTDASPYFRIFNPVTQGQRFDPEGAYVRRWLPELAGVTDRFVHRPWDDPAGPPSGYPLPIVDHAAEREESLRRYAEVRSG
ncbi:MAG: deoxyribodipyrimidine photo-lyase [Acidimicrobiales bacterium]